MHFDRAQNPNQCARCGQHETAHEWRCIYCGVQSKTAPCECGKMHLPTRSCACPAPSWRLYCPESVRRITREQYTEMQETYALQKEYGLDPPLWEQAEAERLLKETLH